MAYFANGTEGDVLNGTSDQRGKSMLLTTMKDAIYQECKPEQQTTAASQVRKERT